MCGLAGEVEHSDPSPETNRSLNETPAIQRKHARDATKAGELGPLEGQLHTQFDSSVRFTTSASSRPFTTVRSVTCIMFGLKQLALFSVLLLSVSATKDEKKTTLVAGRSQKGGVSVD